MVHRGRGLQPHLAFICHSSHYQPTHPPTSPGHVSSCPAPRPPPPPDVAGVGWVVVAAAVVHLAEQALHAAAHGVGVVDVHVVVLTCTNMVSWQAYHTGEESSECHHRAPTATSLVQTAASMLQSRQQPPFTARSPSVRTAHLRPASPQTACRCARHPAPHSPPSPQTLLRKQGAEQRQGVERRTRLARHEQPGSSGRRQQALWHNQSQRAFMLQIAQQQTVLRRTWVGLPLWQVVAVHNDVLGHGDATLLHSADQVWLSK